ncbi:superoxide dismutase [Geitlerinema sp. PCC 7407]|uniref:superoxide dismutase n=1 Tax=Geitlerinema sp. PCC 7407 TaxID=1173025 RepID=UPI00029FDC15|nr:superoxide dismutase [Geitlerinema sp. PCC 7407]AFY67461.1 Manganese/iron superoxide dismutase [Geitlerinema sp. PCC 7407]
MSYEFPNLPYAQDALEPHISANTLSFHHGKHHAKYVSTYNEMVQGTENESKSIEEVIKASYDPSAKAQSGLFNNAAQSWNHTFYWYCMKPGGGGEPTGELAEKIKADFGSFEKFKEEFKAAGGSQFGSGWAWLVLDNGTLKVTKTPDAVNPIAQGQTPLLTMDVWEHAYYLDYQNLRPSYANTFLDSLVNWDFVAEQYAKAK